MRGAAGLVLLLLIVSGCSRPPGPVIISSPPMPVEALAYAPDAELLAAAMHTTVKVWNLRDGKEVLSLTQPEEVLSLAFTRDGKRLALGRFDRTIKIIDVGTGEALIGMDGARGAADVQRGQKKGGPPAAAPAKKESEPPAPGHTGPVTSLAFSPDGSLLASTAGNPNPFGLVVEVKLWNAQTGSLLANLTGSHQNALTCGAFAPDGKTFLTGGRDRKVVVWDLATRKAKKTIDVGTDVTSVALASDGKTAAVGTFGPDVHVLDTSTWTEMGKFQGHEDRVNAVAFAPDSRLLASAGADKLIKVWDPSTGKVQTTLTGHTGRVLAVLFDVSGKTLITGGADGTIRVWDTTSGAERAQLQ
jgi:WD40 repeat protein